MRSETPVVKTCNHELDPKSISYDKTFGRRGRCKHCGCKMIAWRYAELRHNRERMSKKERRRRAAALKAPPISYFRGTGKTEVKGRVLGISLEEEKQGHEHEDR